MRASIMRKRQVQALLKRGERERERDSFSRLDTFYTIGVIGVENKKKKKKRKGKKLPPAIFPPVMQYSWAGTRSLSKRKSRAQTGYRIRWNLLANVTIVGVAYARRNFKESSGPITAATTFASVACERPSIFIDTTALVGSDKLLRGRFVLPRKERNETRSETKGSASVHWFLEFEDSTQSRRGSSSRESSSFFEAGAKL